MGKKKQKKIIPKQIIIGFRIFQKVKYARYKLQFRRLRQTEIVEKVLKQWDAMDDIAKIKFKEQHYDAKYLNLYSSDSGSHISSSSSPSPIQKKKIQKKPQAKVRIFREQSTQKGNQQFKFIQPCQFDHQYTNRVPGNAGQVQQSSSSSSGYSIKIEQPKKKADYYRYHTFVKYYHQKLKNQHPTWSQEQYRTIINMFWQNTKKNNKRTRIAKIHKFNTPDLFKYWQNRNRPLELSQIQKMWVALPRKAKSFWSGKYDHLSAFKLKDFNEQISKKKPLDVQKQVVEPQIQQVKSQNIEMKICLKKKAKKVSKSSPAELLKTLQDWK